MDTFDDVLGPGSASFVSEEARGLRDAVTQRLGSESTAAAAAPPDEKNWAGVGEGVVQDAASGLGPTVPCQSAETDTELPAVIGQNMMKRLPPLHPGLDPSGLKRRMFATLLGPDAKRVLRDFRASLDSMVEGAAEAAKRETDGARARLAEVNLPQSMDAYQASQAAGGGVPPRMWEAIASVQRNHDIDLLKRNLWALKDVADHARSTLEGLVRYVDDDVESDRLFRGEHPSFTGHEVTAAQGPLREQVKSWEGWLEQARSGDDKLLGVLREFETEQKYQLLQCTRGKLEELIPNKKNVKRSGHMGHGEQERQDTGEITAADDLGEEDEEDGINTAPLRAALADLSALIRERQGTVDEFRAKGGTYELRPALVEINAELMRQGGAAGTSGERSDGVAFSGGPPLPAPQSSQPPGANAAAEDQERIRRFESAANASLRDFHRYLANVDALKAHQSSILESVLKENAAFRAALERAGSADAGQDYIQKLEDALLTVDRAKRQLAEGRNFYDVVMPRLERLREEVSDLSARIVAERFDFLDRQESSAEWEERRRLEMEDAKIAAQLAAKEHVDEMKTAEEGGGVPRQDVEQFRKDEEVAAEMARVFREEQEQERRMTDESEEKARNMLKEEEDRHANPIGDGGGGGADPGGGNGGLEETVVAEETIVADINTPPSVSTMQQPLEVELLQMRMDGYGDSNSDGDGVVLHVSSQNGSTQGGSGHGSADDPDVDGESAGGERVGVNASETGDNVRLRIASGGAVALGTVVNNDVNSGIEVTRVEDPPPNSGSQPHQQPRRNQQCSNRWKLSCSRCGWTATVIVTVTVTVLFFMSALKMGARKGGAGTGVLTTLT